MTPLRIGIDGFNLAMPQGTGVATYGRTLAEAITGLGHKLDLVYGVPVALDSPEDIRETLFYGRLSEERGLNDKPVLTLKAKITRALMTPEKRQLLQIPHSGRVITSGLEGRVPPFDRLFTRGNVFDVSARYFRRFKRFLTLTMPDPPEIMHWTYPLPIRLEGARNIYTFHDIVPLKLPHTSLEDKRYYHRLLKHCVDAADHIVTVSESSKSDILEFFPAAQGKITNTYQSFESVEPPSNYELARRLDRLFDLERGGYLLFFGAIEPKKNLGRLIEAYLRSEITTPFIIVGSTGWKSDQELRLLHGGSGTRLKAAKQIRQIDYMPRRLLLDLVQGARAVLFPSLYEGFGLPALEAIAYGVPVMASAASSLPEVTGEAALYVAPYDIDAMVAALKRLDADAGLRDRLAAEGPLQAARFSQGAYRSRLQSLYQSVLAA
ncbi:glycosyltransferase family 4 protein [Sphingomonas sp. AP4-R1]|uniref:glycosyltransferase family 4 protein n=1 Tax=Sphingomonas sp. AP4-R1 TaxID=2735134 RepID=UPI0014934B1A|nr:glycosyltransferase family 1 protein [Sphingomonas sp. AP4-R1]QJU57612.1 glycosyltransferase family 4 protein [Sphingomonas sp. AP4-R1]